MEKYIPCKWEAKENWRSNPHIINLKIKKITRDKEGHYVMIKGSVQEEEITIVNIYIPNIGAHEYIRQTLTDIKGEIDSNTIIVGDFNIPLTPVNRSSKQKIKRETQVLNDTLNEMDLIDIFRHSIQMQKNTPFQVHMGHSPGHKMSLGKSKKTKIISSIFFNQTL